MAPPDSAWLTADQAAHLLRVSRSTLYAYVSRGYIRSQPIPGPSRERRYARDDVERVRRRTEERRDPDKAAAHALQWGLPILESSLTFIDGHRLYYRGHDAVQLAASRSLGDVAALLWTGAVAQTFTTAIEVSRAAPDRSLPFVPRAQSLLAAAAVRDRRAFDLRPNAVAQTGWRIVHLLTRAATLARTSPTLPIDQALGRAWRVDQRGVVLLRAALILCADHELNVSSFTARCVASAGSHPYAVTIAGLAALEGTKHGGASARVESMLDSLPRNRGLRHAVAERLRRGERLDGFGHPLYRDGDPRARAILDRLRDGYGRSSELTFVFEVASAAAGATQEKPNLDFALVALSRVLRLPAGSALTVFALGRTIGWIGHAIEQYGANQLIRPRAKYVGVVPAVS